MANRSVDLGRRGFLTGRSPSGPPVIRPPWSREETIAKACTSCGACVKACPQSILKLGVGKRPQVDFSAGECTFCGACAESCPEPVFDRAEAAFSHVAVIDDACFARRGIVCQSCRDACPENAIQFPPRLGGPALPILVSERCTGCGACVASCPAHAITAWPSIKEAVHA